MTRAGADSSRRALILIGVHRQQCAGILSPKIYGEEVTPGLHFIMRLQKVGRKNANMMETVLDIPHQQRSSHQGQCDGEVRCSCSIQVNRHAVSAAYEVNNPAFSDSPETLA